MPRAPEVGLDHLRVVLHLGRRPLGDLAPEVEHDDLVGDAHHQLHVVLDEQHGEPVPIAEVADRVAELVDLGVGEPGRRLVEQQQRGLGRHRPGELDPLERAVRQAGRRAQGVLGEAEVGRGCPSRPGSAGALLDAHADAERCRREVRPCCWLCAPTITFSSTVRRGNSARFWNVRATPSPAMPWAWTPEQVAAVEVDVAALRLVDPRDDVEQGRLAGAVGADQPADLTLLDREREVVERDDDRRSEPRRRARREVPRVCPPSSTALTPNAAVAVTVANSSTATVTPSVSVGREGFEPP